jgi:hypothetical protein
MIARLAALLFATTSAVVSLLAIQAGETAPEVLAQQRDAAPSQPAPAGTAEISGRVLTADSNPQPLRRAVVTLTGDIPNPRSVLTDDGGRFVFSRLPAGAFSVTARKAAYLAAPFGARRPGRAGMAIALTDAQRESISIVMFRGAAITGVLRDRFGTPVRGVDVRAIDARTLLVAPDAVPTEIATTDDRGVYRIYGLPPGEYFIAALPLLGGSGEITAPSASAIDAALAMLAARRPPAPGVKPAPATAAPQPTLGFAPVYYPGTANHSEAAGVRVQAGEDRTGVDFEVRPLLMAAIDGVVRGDVPSLSAVRVSIIPSGPSVQTVIYSGSVSGRPMDAEGRFRYTNLSPGRYRVIARAQRGDVTPPTPRIVDGVQIRGRAGGAAPPTAAADYLYGVADVEVRGEDVASVSLVLQPGGTIAGRLTFDSAGVTPAPSDLSTVRVSLSLEGGWGSVSSGGLTIGTSLLSSPISLVRRDGTFEIRGIGPGRFTLNVAFPSAALAGPWKPRSAVVSGRNVLGDPLDLGPGVDVRDVTIGFSDRITELSGTLQGVSGELITEYYLVVIPADRSMWRPRSRRIVSVRPATDGRFVFADLLAGEYVLAAVTDLDPIDLWDTAFLAQIAAAGVPVTVAEREKKVHNLRVR